MSVAFGGDHYTRPVRLVLSGVYHAPALCEEGCAAYLHLECRTGWLWSRAFGGVAER
jgi:hypothetical protein